MLLIADTGPIISLILIGEFNLIEKLFHNFLVPGEVWNELSRHSEIMSYKKDLAQISDKRRDVDFPYSISGIDRGETEAILLFQEMKADYLLIDDKKARLKAELIGINCIGTLGVLYLAQRKGFIQNLRPLFIKLQKHNRFYSYKYLNYFLRKTNELEIRTNKFN
ncbi:MAG: DUF3368 domain-containing protein [Bacteroidales bacterium]|nr:DUF3368 domain-containing protein [Bacteroidales bacterium]MCF8458596.1 DUF3368 domain-containing protein [Bacteroidales bacterium]